jgi:hypothetical protein
MNIPLEDILKHIAIGFYFLACFRVLVYRKQGARHRRHVSWVAWAILVLLGGSGIELALSSQPFSCMEAARTALIDLIIYNARGNVARLLWKE